MVRHGRLNRLERQLTLGLVVQRVGKLAAAFADLAGLFVMSLEPLGLFDKVGEIGRNWDKMEPWLDPVEVPQLTAGQRADPQNGTSGGQFQNRCRPGWRIAVAWHVDLELEGAER